MHIIYTNVLFFFALTFNKYIYMYTDLYIYIYKYEYTLYIYIPGTCLSSFGGQNKPPKEGPNSNQNGGSSKVYTYFLPFG